MQKKSVLCALALAVVTGVMIFLLSSGYSVPGEITFRGDGLLGEALVKSIQENGLKGNLFNYRLGAPDEMAAIVDTPFLDWIYVFEVWMIGLFVESPGVVLILFHWLGYILASLTMFYLLRKLKMNYAVSFVFSLLFSFSTYHAFRGMGHGTLSNYFMVPVAVLLALYIATGGTDFAVLKEGKNKKAEGILFSILSLGLGFTNIYFIAFGLILMVFAFLYRIIKVRFSKRSLRYLLYPGLTLAGTVISLSPKIFFSLRYGANINAGTRSYIESEVYSLKLIQMLLPPYYSKLEDWTGLTRKYMEENNFISENCMASIGLIAAAGFLFLCGYLIVAFVNKEKDKDVLLNFNALSVLVCVLFATWGGFGAIFNFFFIRAIRCYNRITIYIICICLITVAWLLQKHVKKKAVCCGILVLLLGISAVDQIRPTVSEVWIGQGNHAAAAKEFYSRIEDSLEENAMVYQAPFIGFPESENLNDLDCYEQLRAYVFTDSLHFSHGGMKGRNYQAQYLYKDDGMSREFVAGIIDKGFSGICIYLDGYTKRQQEKIIHFYSEELGLTPIVSGDAKTYFYNLSGLNKAALENERTNVRQNDET